MKTYCPIRGWEYTIGLQCRECARMKKNDLYERLRHCKCGTCLPCLAFVEIERLQTELAASPRVMIHEHWNGPALEPSEYQGLVTDSIDVPR